MPKIGSTPKLPTSMRLSPEAKRMLARLAAKNAISVSAWLETTIRKEARRQKVETEDDDAA